MSDARSSLEALRTVLAADAALADRLAQLGDERVFAAAAAIAAQHGIALDAAAIASAAPSDPPGIVLQIPAPANISHWPGEGWLPVHLDVYRDPTVVWAHGGGAVPPVLDQGTLREIANNPFNRLIRPRMTRADFVAGAPAVEAPAGFIFHMSRCGSTLAANMLGALPDSLTLSEIGPVNAAVLCAYAEDGTGSAQRIAVLRAILAAYRGHARRLFVRFEAWHALALPLLREAFPETPFVFLYRDPVEVLVSHHRAGARDLASHIMAERIWRIEGYEQMEEDELAARALGRICNNALDHLDSGGVALNYSELPDAVWKRVLPHFGIEADPSVRERMARVARTNARTGIAPFTDDRAEKQRHADALLRQRASEHIGEAYRRLDALRIS